MTREPAPAPATPVTLAATNKGMYDSPLQPNTAYTWTVKAVQADGREGSTKVTFTTPPAMNPAGFSAKQTGSGQVELSWLAVDGAPSYGVFGPGAQGGKRVTDTTKVDAG